jgi:hypothetical protein
VSKSDCQASEAVGAPHLERSRYGSFLTVVPSSLRGRFPGELFYEQYGVSLHWVHLEDASLEDCFRRCYETGRPLVVYEFNKDFIQNVLTVFTI